MSQVHGNHQWECLNVLTKDQKLILVLLNAKVENIKILQQLWDNAILKICCDGGANRLYDISKQHESQHRYIPDFVCGDFDSTSDYVKEFYVKQGAKAIILDDQNNTDFTKSLLFAVKHCEKENIKYDSIVAFISENGGRCDHMLGNINTLYKTHQVVEKPCYLLTTVDISFLLHPGKNVIVTDTRLEGSYCGLIPVGQKVDKVKTTGLKWNLDNQSLSFGELISTSNCLADSQKEVIVETTHVLLWTLTYDFEKM